MALTRGDKFIIAGAITLALVVVLGLAIWKKPYLFTGGAPTAPAAATGAAEGASQSEQAAAEPNAQKTAPLPEPATHAAAAPVIPEPPMETPAQSASPAQDLPAPMASGTGQAALPPNAGDQPQEPAALAKEDQILFKGDETLDKMFSEMGKPDDALPLPKDKPAKTAEATPGKEQEPPSPEAASSPDALLEPEASEAAKAPAVGEPSGAPGKETAASPPKADAMDEKTPPKKATPKPKPAPKTAPVSGSVLGVVPESRPGEFLFTIKTNASISGYEKFFLSNPSRVVLDIAGNWRYPGPWSLSGKGPLVQSIRLGRHAGKLRIVLDLTPDAELQLRAAPEVSRIQNGLVVRLR